MIKQRIARRGQGKSGGYRSVILFRKGKLALFLYGYAKSDRDNLDADELAAFKIVARDFQSITQRQIKHMIEIGRITEVL